MWIVKRGKIETAFKHATSAYTLHMVLLGSVMFYRDANKAKRTKSNAPKGDN